MLEHKRLQAKAALMGCAIAALVSAAGCAYLQEKLGLKKAAEPSMETTPEPEPAAPEPVPPPPVGTIGDAIAWIEAGRYEQAAALLRHMAGQGRGGPTQRFLLRQLEQAPEQLLPGPYREIELQPGESLSEVAHRELGNPLYFVALARLNQIEVPRSVTAGMSLRVPVRDQRSTETNASPAIASEAPVADSARPADEAPSADQDVLWMAEYLVASGDTPQALRVLTQALRDGNGSPEVEARYLELGEQLVDDALANEQPERALRWLDQAAELVREPHVQEQLRNRARELRAAGRVAEARRLASEGDLEGAWAAAQAALELAPNDPSVIGLERELKERWTQNLHEQALLAWRDRDVDQAIRLWQALLARAPDFRPAAVYLFRAMELRRRLSESEPEGW